MNEDFYISLIQKQLSKELSAEEAGQLKVWEEASEANQQFAAEIRKAWELGGKYADPPLVSLNLDAEFALLEKRIAAKESKEAPIRPLRSLPLWGRIAAVIVLLVGLGFLLRNVLQPTVQWQELNTMAEANQLLELEDGSKVWVNANSQLRYPEAFEGKQRLVYLEGQAFFEVEHNPKKPFIVQTPDARVKVLGTSFDVKEGEKLVVQVVEGKVQVDWKEGEEPKVLTANQQLTYVPSDLTPSLNLTPSPHGLAWHTGVLAFQDVPLEEVVVAIEDFYGVEIEIDSEPMIDCPIDVREGASAKEMLEIIADVFGMTLEEKGPQQFLLEGGSCE